MNEYKIFVSRSFDGRDKDVVEPILELCRATGYVPIQTERASQNVPREKIREALTESRVFLGILTLDADRPGGVTKEWLVTEIGMAEFARLPIILFLEQGVVFRPADHITSYQHFSRDRPFDLWKMVVRALVELREDSRVVWGNEIGNGDRPYKFAVDDVAIEIGPDGTLKHERHIEVVSLINSLRAIAPIRKTITSSEKLGYHDSTFAFGHGTRGAESKFQLRVNTPSEVSYQVLFPQSLHKDSVTDFTVVHESRGSLPLSREDLSELRRADYITTSDVARQGHSVHVNTDRLTMSLRFPDGYPVEACRPRLSVTLRDRVGDSVQAQTEYDRICHNFKVRHNRIELELEYPKVDHAYYFEWTPPRLADLPENFPRTIASEGR